MKQILRFLLNNTFAQIVAFFALLYGAAFLSKYGSTDSIIITMGQSHNLSEATNEKAEIQNTEKSVIFAIKHSIDLNNQISLETTNLSSPTLHSREAAVAPELSHSQIEKNKNHTLVKGLEIPEMSETYYMMTGESEGKITGNVYKSSSTKPTGRATLLSRIEIIGFSMTLLLVGSVAGGIICSQPSFQRFAKSLTDKEV